MALVWLKVPAKEVRAGEAFLAFDINHAVPPLENMDDANILVVYGVAHWRGGSELPPEYLEELVWVCRKTVSTEMLDRLWEPQEEA